MYADDLQIYPFSSSSDSGLIQISMFNFITDLTYWFSHNSISLNMTKTNRINLLSYSQDTVNCGEFSSINHSSFYTISSTFSIYNYPMFHYNLSTRTQLNALITIFYIILENLVISLPLP